jgi:hypothetical protein
LSLLTDIVRVIGSERMTVGHVAGMDEQRNACRVFVGRPEGKRPLGGSRGRWV